MTNEQHHLLMYIDQISFALDDTVLFLDTHPCDTEALAYYQELKEEDGNGKIRFQIRSIAK